MKKVTEWFVDVPWGKVALISWGDASKKPVLLVHGYMDSAATFSLLVELLPDTHYYVAVDLPDVSAIASFLELQHHDESFEWIFNDTIGALKWHGKSDPFLQGPLGDFYYYVEVVQAVVHHLQWTDFVYLAHSMGFVLGTLYNHVHPNKICCMINIDPAVAISMVHIMSYMNFNLPQLYELNFAELDETKTKKPHVFSREEAVQYVMRRRLLTEKQAETVLSRSLVAVEDGTYRLSWCSRAKLIATLSIPTNTFYEIFSSNPLPMLMLHARGKDTDRMPDSLRNNLWLRIEGRPWVKSVAIGGGHDIHITNPENCAENITQFLDKNFSFIKKSKI